MSRLAASVRGLTTETRRTRRRPRGWQCAFAPAVRPVVRSEDEPFDKVILHSDNDPAACYSFNVDDITVAAEVPETSVAAAKGVPAGEILLANLAVTRLHEADGRFNMETADGRRGLPSPT